MTKLETLKQALDSRNEEILNYQINIDNFDLAIKKIEVEHPDNEDLKDFKRTLIELLDGNKKQQLRSIIIRDVIEEQVKELSKN